VAVNAAPSYDPDEEEGSLAFRWLCGRSDGLDCRTAQGELLPSRMTNSSLAGLKLQAVAGGSLCYTFTLSVAKGGRVASSSTTVREHIFANRRVVLSVKASSPHQGGGGSGLAALALGEKGTGRLGAAKGCCCAGLAACGSAGVPTRPAGYTGDWLTGRLWNTVSCASRPLHVTHADCR
jgi:hypothetical protein